MKVVYKVLVDGKSCHGGVSEWSLPDDHPGDWMNCEGELVMCKNGIHLTTQPELWLKPGCKIYEAEAIDIQEWSRDKCVCRSARLIREVPPPSWWSEVDRFISVVIPSIPWGSHCGEVSVPHLKFETRAAAWGAMRVAMRDAAWDAAWDAEMICFILCLCGDLPIAMQHRQYASDVLGIMEAGFFVAGKVENTYYIY